MGCIRIQSRYWIQFSKTVKNFNMTIFTAFIATHCWSGRKSNIFEETKPSFVSPFRPAAPLTPLWEKLEVTITNARLQACVPLLLPYLTEVYNSRDSFRLMFTVQFRVSLLVTL